LWSRATKDASGLEVILKKMNNVLELQKIQDQVNQCTLCSLCKTKGNYYVFGEGNVNAELMFVGEAPGFNESETGRPFIGKAGQLLTKMIEAIRLTRDSVYITNIVKCRPPENRKPTDEEIASCLPYLISQIKLIDPKVICLLGTTAFKVLIKESKLTISQSHGRIYHRTYYDRWRICIPTFHPAYLLRRPDMKCLAFNDLKIIKSQLEIELKESAIIY